MFEETKKFLYILFVITFAASDMITQEDRITVLKYHNEKRSNVNPTASNMVELVSLTGIYCCLLTIPY